MGAEGRALCRVERACENAAGRRSLVVLISGDWSPMRRRGLRRGPSAEYSIFGYVWWRESVLWCLFEGGDGEKMNS